MSPAYRETANEPEVHDLLRQSFAYVPSAGMRLAPEILVLELMREVFEERPRPMRGSRNLDPDQRSDDQEFIHTEVERAVLSALRGRRRKSRHSSTESFYAPAYPHLAKNGWLGTNRERVICNFLLGGPVAQCLWGQGRTDAAKERHASLAHAIVSALAGHRSSDTVEGMDILAAALGNEDLCVDGEAARRRVLAETETSDERILDVGSDELAERITNDFRAICSVEKDLPRHQWMQLLMTFLRLALPMWLLAQMQTTRLLHSWLIEAMEEHPSPDPMTIKRKLRDRNRGLLQPTLSPTRELFEHTERYMKCRVEVSILLYHLARAGVDKLNKRLTVTKTGSDFVSLTELLVLVRSVSRDGRRLRQAFGDHDIRTFLTREGERHAAWRNPLMRGQGKNIDEFFRVLYRSDLGDEAGGYLLTPEGRGARRGFRVFPGQLLLKTATYLAGQRKRAPVGGGGKLVLEDVEEHFCEYGIDFSVAADARPRLMEQLQNLGLLKGSPDAGSSAAVSVPY